MQCLPSGDLLDNMMHNIWPQDFLSLFLVLPAPCRENPEKKVMHRAEKNELPSLLVIHLLYLKTT